MVNVSPVEYALCCPRSTALTVRVRVWGRARVCVYAFVWNHWHSVLTSSTSAFWLMVISVGIRNCARESRWTRFPPSQRAGFNPTASNQFDTGLYVSILPTRGSFESFKLGVSMARAMSSGFQKNWGKDLQQDLSVILYQISGGHCTSPPPHTHHLLCFCFQCKGNVTDVLQFPTFKHAMSIICELRPCVWRREKDVEGDMIIYHQSVHRRLPLKKIPTVMSNIFFLHWTCTRLRACRPQSAFVFYLLLLCSARIVWHSSRDLRRKPHTGKVTALLL